MTAFVPSFGLQTFDQLSLLIVIHTVINSRFAIPSTCGPNLPQVAGVSYTFICLADLFDVLIFNPQHSTFRPPLVPPDADVV